MRPPRPRPKVLIARHRSSSPTESFQEASNKKEQEIDDDSTAGYETCDEHITGGDFTDALVASANPVITILAHMDVGAAKIVQALCDRLQEMEGQVGKARLKVRRARLHRDEAQAKLEAQQDLQGQSGRHWRLVQKLKGRVDFAMHKNSLLRQQMWKEYHRHVPYKHPP